MLITPFLQGILFKPSPEIMNILVLSTKNTALQDIQSSWCLWHAGFLSSEGNTLLKQDHTWVFLWEVFLCLYKTFCPELSANLRIHWANIWDLHSFRLILMHFLGIQPSLLSACPHMINTDDLYSPLGRSPTAETFPAAQRTRRWAPKDLEI